MLVHVKFISHLIMIYYILHIETNIEELNNIMQINLSYVNENKTTPNNHSNDDIFS